MNRTHEHIVLGVGGSAETIALYQAESGLLDIRRLNSAHISRARARRGHVVIPDNVYGGTWDLVHDVYQRWGLAYTAVDMADLDAVAAAIRPETALVWTETPRTRC